MTAVAVAPTKQAKPAKLTPDSFAATTAVLLLEQRKPGFSRQIPSGEVVAASDDVDRRMLSVTKRLLDKQVMREINREDASIKNFLEIRAAYCSMLARGMWAIPLGVFEEVEAELDGYKARRAALVTTLVDKKYDDAIDKARRSLGKHFRGSEYPTKDELRAEFGVTTRWLSFNVPAALEEVSKEIYERESARLAREVESAAGEIERAYGEAFAALIEHAADRLGTDAASGKPNKFQDSTITKLQDFVETFGKRNITNNADLARLAEQARQVLAGVPAEQVRSNDATRNRVLAAVSDIKAKLTAMNVVAPAKRKLGKEVA